MSNETIDTESKELWESAKSFLIITLKSQEEKSQAERYLGMITSVSAEGSKFKILTSNDFTAGLLRDEYINKLRGSFLVAGAPPDLEIEIACDHSARSTMIIPTEKTDGPFRNAEGRSSSFVSTLPLNEEYTFDTFVRGPSNSYAISAAEGVVRNPANPIYNPLFIHGGTGLGKTHLMQAIGNELRKKNPSMMICYLTSETFLNEYVTSLQNGQIESFRHKYRSLDLLLIDDIQFFARGKDVQVEFFNTFNALKDSRKQIVMTSDVAPKNLPSIESRLISRFEGGMVQEIENPSYETRLAILKKKMEISEVRLPDSVLEFIADNIKSHVRAMEGALTKVTHAIIAEPSLYLTNEKLSYILKDFIEKEQSLRKLTIKEIQQTCANKYGVTMADIMSHERIQSLVTPRQLAMYISKKYTSKGLQEIATAFGKKHATIINGVKTITGRLTNEPELKSDLEEILSSFGYRLSDSMD